MALKSKPEQLELHCGPSKLLPDGSELPDPRPMSLPVGFERPPSIQELIRKLVLDPKLREEITSDEIETFDDADDFNVEDDLPVNSPHEDQFDPLHLLTREQEIRSGTVKEPDFKANRDRIKMLSDELKALKKAQKEAELSDEPESTANGKDA